MAAVKNRLIIAVSGASGAPLAIALLRQLKTEHSEVETHLIVTKGALLTLQQETDCTLEDLKRLVSVYHENDDIGASVASGSFKTMGMVVCPCSMKTLAGIVSGYSDNLLLRAADVCMKEKRKLVLVPRETPLSQLHLENMAKAGRYGAVILPPVLGFYYKPETLDDVIHAVVQRILSQFDLDTDSYEWGDDNDINNSGL